jgi:hypothetical protein
VGNCERTREWGREKKERYAIVSWFVAVAARSEPSVEKFFGSTPARTHAWNFRPSSRIFKEFCHSFHPHVFCHPVTWHKTEYLPIQNRLSSCIVWHYYLQSPSEESITSFVMAVHPSVPTQQFFSHRTYFREISYSGIFIKICRNIRILSKSDLNNRQFTWRLTFSHGPICATVETGEIQERCEISRNRTQDSCVAESPMCTFMCCVRNTSHYTK